MRLLKTRLLEETLSGEFGSQYLLKNRAGGWFLLLYSVAVDPYFLCTTLKIERIFKIQGKTPVTKVTKLQTHRWKCLFLVYVPKLSI